MKLLRNESLDGTGKYAVIDLRKAPELAAHMASAGPEGYASVPVAAINLGTTPEKSFFVLKLKDQFACAALIAYSEAVYMYADRLAEAARAIDAEAENNRAKHEDSTKIMREVLELREYAKEVEALSTSAIRAGVTVKLPD